MRDKWRGHFLIPSTGLQSHADDVRPTISVTAQFLFPTLTVRIAASAAVQAALKTSARRPVTGFSAFAPITMVSALMAANPSMWAPNWILTTSPFARTWEACGSDLYKEVNVQSKKKNERSGPIDDVESTYASGEKCETALFTEIHVGNDTPGWLAQWTILRKKNNSQIGCVPLGTFAPLTFLL